MGDSVLHDLAYLEATVEELQPYLLSDDLYWTLSGYPSPSNQPFHKFTLGGMLLALTRSRSQVMSSVDSARLSSLTNKLEAFSTKWRVAWEAKAGKEFRSRLRQWGSYLTELQQEPQEHAVYYPYEVRVRVMAELLKGQIEVFEVAENEFLHKLDQRLGAQFLPGDFIWDNALSVGFPKTEFWFLWGKPIF